MFGVHGRGIVGGEWLYRGTGKKWVTTEHWESTSALRVTEVFVGGLRQCNATHSRRVSRGRLSFSWTRLSTTRIITLLNRQPGHWTISQRIDTWIESQSVGT